METIAQSVKSQVSRFFEIPEKISFLQGQLDLGRPIFPLHDMIRPGGIAHCGCNLGTRCPGPGKHPLIAWSKPLDPKDPQARRYIDAVVRQWPERGWGLHLGLSGLAVLDIDPRHGGNESAADLVRNLDLPLRWPTVATGGGGVHYYFQAPADTDPVKGVRGLNGHTSTNIALGAGVEWLSGQHYVVLPYSPHASGGWYSPVSVAAPGPVPEPLVKFINQLEVFRENKPKSHSYGQIAGQLDREGSSQDRLPCSTAEKRAEAWIEKRSPAIAGSGGRKHTFATAAALVIDFALPLPDAWRLLAEWNRSCQPPWDQDQLRLILETADGKPGERGSKLRTPYSAYGRAQGEDLAWLDQLDFDLLTPEWIHEFRAGGKIGLRARPRPLAITQEELDSIGLPQVVGGCSEPARDVVWNCSETVNRANECQGREQHAEVTGKPLPAEQPQQPDPQYVYSAGPECTCAINLLLGDPKTGVFFDQRKPGKQWDCPSCGPRRKAHLNATHTHWLADWAAEKDGADALNLHFAIVAKGLWKKIGSSIRARHGSFFRLDHMAQGSCPGGCYMVVSNVATSHCVWEKISPEEANWRLTQAIDALPTDLHVRVWWSSRNWPLLPDQPKKDPKYKNYGTPHGTQKERCDMYEAEKIETKRIIIPGRFFPGTALMGKYAGPDFEGFMQALSDGFDLRKFQIEIGCKPGTYLETDGSAEQQFLSS